MHSWDVDHLHFACESRVLRYCQAWARPTLRLFQDLSRCHRRPKSWWLHRGRVEAVSPKGTILAWQIPTGLMSLTTFFNFLDTLVKDTRRIKDNRIISDNHVYYIWFSTVLVTRHSHTAWTRAPGTVGTPGTPGVPLHSPRVHTCLGQTWNAMHSRFLMRSLSLHLSRGFEELKSIVFMFWIHTGVFFPLYFFSPCYMPCFLFRYSLRIPQPDVRLDTWGRVLLAARLARRFRDGPESVRTGKLQPLFSHAKRFATKYKLNQVDNHWQIANPEFVNTMGIAGVLFTELRVCNLESKPCDDWTEHVKFGILVSHFALCMSAAL